MSKNLTECMALGLYLEAAERIIEELDARGFSTPVPENAENLEMVVAGIIERTVRGNTNVTTAGGDGWEDDLQNQE